VEVGVGRVVCSVDEDDSIEINGIVGISLVVVVGT
jgi:hypothetical protein